MRILSVIPWRPDERISTYEREYSPSDVDVVGLKSGTVIECSSDLARCVPEFLDVIADAEGQGYDAIIMPGFADPGIEEARELVDIPVLGPVKVGLHIAQILGYKTLVLVIDYTQLRVIHRRLSIAYGLQDKVVIWGTYAKVSDSLAAFEEYKVTGKISPFIAENIDICVKAIEEDDVDTITFGCGAAMWLKDILEDELHKRGYEVTVMNPLAVTIELARLLVNLKLTHSRRAYPRTPHAQERYVPGSFGQRGGA